MTDPLLDRVPPHSMEAEMSVLGAMCLSDGAFVECQDMLRVEDFYRQEHGTIFGVLLDMASRKIKIDFVTVRQALCDVGQLDEIGGDAYLVTLADSVPTVANAEYYAQIVKEMAVRRNMIQAAGEMVRDAHALDDDLGAVLDRSEARVMDLSRVRRQTDDGLVSAETILASPPSRGFNRGFSDLDDMTLGLSAGDMEIIGGRTSMGKTALALSFAWYVAMHENRGVAFVSCEMSQAQMVERLVSLCTGIPLMRVRLRDFRGDETPQLDEFYRLMATNRLRLFVRRRIMLGELRSMVRWLVSKCGTALVVVDFIQRMGLPAGTKEIRLGVSENSHGIKDLAMECNIPVIVLSQLGRDSEDYQAPQLRHLRETGNLEEDCDNCILIDRKPNAEAAGVGGAVKAKLHMAKSRNGAVGVADVYWQPAQARYVPAYSEARDPPREAAPAPVSQQVDGEGAHDG